MHHGCHILHLCGTLVVQVVELKESSMESWLEIWPHLSKMVLVLFCCCWFYSVKKLTGLLSLMIKLQIDTTGWMQGYSGEFCLPDFSQKHKNPRDNISSFSSARIPITVPVKSLDTPHLSNIFFFLLLIFSSLYRNAAGINPYKKS